MDEGKGADEPAHGANAKLGRLLVALEQKQYKNANDDFVHVPGGLNEMVDISETTGAEMINEAGEPSEVFDGDYVMVKGNKGLRLACMVQPREEGLPDGYVCLNKCARKNLKTGGDDLITVTVCDAMENAKRVVFAAIDETVEDIAGDLKTVFLDPYYQSPFFGADGRPVTKGSLVACQGASTTAWFKVMEVSSNNGQDYGKVVSSGPREGWTELVVLPDKISLEEGEAALNEVGYSDIGGLGEQLQTIREMVEVGLWECASNFLGG